MAEPADALRALGQTQRVHAAVERSRGYPIPSWPHRAVLYMLIDYSERAASLLGGPLEAAAQQALYADFRRIGEGLGIVGLPPDYAAWHADRTRRLGEDVAWGPATAALYEAYRRQLGSWRYGLLRRLQAVLVPAIVRHLIRLPPPASGARLLTVFRSCRALGLASVAGAWSFRRGIGRTSKPSNSYHARPSILRPNEMPISCGRSGPAPAQTYVP